MEHKLKKAVLTGASSTIGLALIHKLLEEGIEKILLLQRGESAKLKYLPKDGRIDFIDCKLEELKHYAPKESGYDVFFHLGWANAAKELREDIEGQSKNVVYSCDAVEVAHKLGCHTFIGAGSQAEYGRHMEPLREDTLCLPETAYGVMKLSACHATQIICRKYGMRHIWPRILSVYGMYDNRRSVLASNILNGIQGKELAFSRGEQVWDFIYTDDVANALYFIAKKGKDGEKYPVGSGKARKLKEYIYILCEKLGKLEEMELGKIPYSDSQVMHLEADISRLQADTGWEPEVAFEDGIEKEIEFYRAEMRWGMEDDIMVSVLCTAYNHEGFIRDAIEGVLNQKVDFRYELIIHEDASTDGTREIVNQYAESYPHMIRTILQEKNQYHSCNIYQSYLFPAARGKYIAFCEGDDYWVDPTKLQKQVEFLETHDSYSMCMHNAVKLNCETGEKRLLDTFQEDGCYSQEEQVLAGLGTGFPAFASYLIRAELLKDMPDFFLASKVLDYPIRQYYANCGKIQYFKKPMSVYRASTPQSYMKKTLEDQLFYNEYTLEMIQFFEKFNLYTEKKFNSILEVKIMSDYYGFCLSIPEKEGLKKARGRGLNGDKIRECYQRLSLDYTDIGLMEVCRKSSHIFIYGASRIAPICKKQLEHKGIQVDGFAVSDGQMKPEAIEGKKVYYLSEVIEGYTDPGFVLALQPVNAVAVAEVLENKGLYNYCKPYTIGNP